MRFLLPAGLLCSLLVSVRASPEVAKDPAAVGEAISIQTAPAVASTTAEDDGSTTFNGMRVPPLKELNGETFDEDTKDGYWFVKHYSPYCHHCKAVAPTWQTAYEFYYVRHMANSRETSTDYDRHRKPSQPRPRMNPLSMTSRDITTSTLHLSIVWPLALPATSTKYTRIQPSYSTRMVS